MNKILLGRNASYALILMKEIGVFNLSICNSIKNIKNSFLPGFNQLSNEQFHILDKFNSMSIIKNSNSTVEAWAVIFKILGVEAARNNLETIYPISNNDIEKVEWLIEYFDLINSEDIKNDIFNARTGIVQRYKLMCMVELIDRLCKIHLALNGACYKDKVENLKRIFRSRPYFPEQLKVTGEEMMEIAQEKPGRWISTAKDKLLYKLINVEKFPKENINTYMELVKEAIEEALVEETMKNEGLI